MADKESPRWIVKEEIWSIDHLNAEFNYYLVDTLNKNKFEQIDKKAAKKLANYLNELESD